METYPSAKKTISLNIDLNAALTGFGSARIATPAHHRIVKHFASPLFFGPPVSDDLLAIVMHMFTEDEADLVQHLPPLRPRSTEKIAKRSGRSVTEVKQVLDNLAFTKVVIFSTGDPRKYTILPIVPGTFEFALLTTDLSTRNTWHKTFAELFERLWDKGFMLDYFSKTRPLIRYLPVQSVSHTLKMAWPSDKLEEILEPYDDFAVGNCQCRLAMKLVGKGCNRPLENCSVIGPGSKTIVERGLMRRVDRQEYIAIKRHAEETGCVSWMENKIGAKPLINSSCSCCGCCCHNLRTVTQFNAPGIISKPHFLPALNPDKCKLCQKCIQACPMGTWTLLDKSLEFAKPRCIGCGLCVVACKFGALTLEPAPDMTPHQMSWLEASLSIIPRYLTNAFQIWLKRLLYF